MEKEIKKQMEIIKKNVVEIIEEKELESKLERALKENKPLRIKYGIDPTAPEIHLGHTVPIRKLRDFQELGHKVIFLIGDFTARIGDPTGRKETRPILSPEEIQKNLSTYKEQVSKILDIDKTEFVYNSSWLSKLNLEEVVKLTSIFTVAQILEREDFTERYKERRPIFLHEFLYPLLQGYDSYALASDIEIGATEQKFNLLAGRTIQSYLGQEKQVVITMPILIGTDGKLKMSKSYGNHIPLNADPFDMFGKIMSIPDNIMEEYFSLLTNVKSDIYIELIKKNPREGKAFLARKIVEWIYDEEKARIAEEEFNRIFREKEIPSEVPEVIIKNDILNNNEEIEIIELLSKTGMVNSKSEAKRLIIQKAIKVNGEVIFEPYKKIKIKDGMVIKIGKRKFFKIKRT
ncbi:MAG: tyrosine--tRNA ligase [bacterium]|nr:tyrosine--tRNA ligase [bacterium]MCX7917961.1 tyrosine--tRNA ligase [bacterium]MDW8163732.1 tyrosine--tRNA ligase [Candidatus Omnitrophota bacterium]